MQVIYFFVEVCLIKNENDNDNGKSPSITRAIGIIERILYTIALIMGLPQWIGIWLTLKVAVTWKKWEGKSRDQYNIFLIGNALSILFGVIGTWVVLGKLPINELCK